MSTPVSTHGSGRDRWRGGGVYLDGEPIAVLRYAELPVGLQPIWETQRKRLPFRPGEAIRYEERRVPRYRVTDYLRALGVDLAQVREVHLHGARDSAVVITRDDLQRHADDVLFKFAGDTFGKPIPIVRNLDVGTTFDDLVALTIYVKRTPPTLTADHTLELDGQEVRGIPYHGEPLREGVRVYIDNRLAAVLKRNQLQMTGTQWRLADVLARQGIAVARIARIELIHDEARTSALAWNDPSFTFNPSASGEILIGAEQRPAHSLALFTDPRSTLQH